MPQSKKLQQSQAEDSARLQAILRSAPYAITVTDLKGRIVDCGNATVELHGFSAKDELIGKSAFDLIAKKDHRKAEKKMKQTLEQGSIRHVKYTFLKKDRTKFPAELSASILRDAGGHPIGFMAVTRRRIKEKSLSALNVHGRKLNTANTLEEVVDLTLDAMGQTLGFEHAAFMVVEKDQLKVIGQRGYPTPLNLALPLDGSQGGVTVKTAVNRQPILIQDTRNAADYVEGIHGICSELAVPIEAEETSVGVLNVESRNLGAFDDDDLNLLQILASHASTAISNLQRRNEIERRSNQLSSLMKSSVKMIGSTDLHQRLHSIAEAIRELGWRRVVISVRDREMAVVNREDIVTAGLTPEEVEFLWNHRSSGKKALERLGPDYERFRIGSFYHLPWSDPWVREKFSSNTVPSRLQEEDMVDWDPQDLLYAPLRLADGRIVGVLSIDDPLDGRRPTKESLTPLELFIHPAAVALENAQLIKRLNEMQQQLRADAELLEMKVEERTKELRDSQRKLLRAERLATMGELARMVGHDLRNPLTGIATAAYYLKSKLKSKTSPKIREMLEFIEKDIEYSNKIINDLLEYSKEMKLERKQVLLRSIVEEAVSLVKVPENVKVEISSATSPNVCVDVYKMKRVFVNLIKNSLDAMPAGGKLTVKLEESDPWFIASFSDDGIGLPEELLKKMWQPLFTTKAKGMGLGLPICKRIVEAHGGEISAESQLGEGTTITISIPITPEVEGGESEWLKTPESLLSMTKTV
jgi:PAS domain S-box-containing protein